ncbi:MAG TPA: hypothetical protein VND97_02400 [Beijerinckiaceae bacterium]|nr:hypothetical protein [Beijerinckiaceae bacterium]
MRLIIGLILGALITIGAAYIHDSMVASSMSGPDQSGERMVNWNVVDNSFDRLAGDVRGEWDRLVGRGSESSTKTRGT